MPELPEVETVRRQLAEEVVGERVVAVEVRQEKSYLGAREIGEEVAEVRRRGKYLFIAFESGAGLAVHLKMTGRLVISKPGQQFDYETAKHTRVVMRLASGRALYFWDTRMFGYVHYLPAIGEAEEKVKNKLGPEPWEITQEELYRKLQKTGRTIKDTILDQSMLAGVGNIYANDGLWKSGILPQRRSRDLSKQEVGKLLRSLREVLKKGLSTNGASDNSYVDAYGEKGAYQNEFLVYGKTKGECPQCGRELNYGKVGGRGTWWCDKCQS